MDEGHLDIALMLQNYILQSRSNTVSHAAADGDLVAMRVLISKNPKSIEEKDDLGFTPLAWAGMPVLVIALLGEHGENRKMLARFSKFLAVGSTVAFAVVAFTPLSTIWYGTVSGLNSELRSFAIAPGPFVSGTDGRQYRTLA